MNPMKPILLVLFSLISLLSVNAQGYDPAKVNKKAAALYSQAIEKAESGAYKDAIELMDQALKLDKKFVDAYLSKAGLYGELKNYTLSIENYEKAFELDPVYSGIINCPMPSISRVKAIFKKPSLLWTIL